MLIGIGKRKLGCERWTWCNEGMDVKSVTGRDTLSDVCFKTNEPD